MLIRFRSPSMVAALRPLHTGQLVGLHSADVRCPNYKQNCYRPPQIAKGCHQFQMCFSVSIRCLSCVEMQCMHQCFDSQKTMHVSEAFNKPPCCVAKSQGCMVLRHRAAHSRMRYGTMHHTTDVIQPHDQDPNHRTVQKVLCSSVCGTC